MKHISHGRYQHYFNSLRVNLYSIRTLRSKQPNKILLSLCGALLGLYSVFVIMIGIDTTKGEAELGPLPCCVLAGLLHYFTLAALFWMGVEGVNMYLMFVKVVDSYVARFMWKASLAAWGKILA